MKSKKKMVESGKIEDARIFKLMYLEKSINEVKLLAELKTRACNDQIEQLKTERQSNIRTFELRAKTLTADVAQIRSAFENEYEISLSEWGYDDLTGVLIPINPAARQRLHEQKALQKDVDAERSEEKKKRVRRKKKVPAKQDPVPNDPDKPPTDSVEA